MLGIPRNRCFKITNTNGFEVIDNDGKFHGYSEIEFFEVEIREQKNTMFSILVTVHARDNEFIDLYRSFIADYNDAKKIYESPRSWLKTIRKVFRDEDINSPEF